MITGIKSTRILANGGIMAGTVCIKDNKIVTVSAEPCEVDTLIDVGDKYVSELMRKEGSRAK